MRLRVSILPAAVALAALFLVLPQTGADATITMTGPEGGWQFSPVNSTVERSARIGFTNSTRATHTATCAPGDQAACSWDSGDVQPGQTVFVELPDEDASYTYFCRYHGQSLRMVGTISVGALPAPAEASPSPSP